MHSISLVKDSYATWLESAEYLKSRESDIFFVGFQETLSEDFEILKAKLGLPDGVELPIDDVQAHRNPANLDRKLEDRAVQNLNDWFKDDYRFVSLCSDMIGRRG